MVEHLGRSPEYHEINEGQKKYFVGNISEFGGTRGYFVGYFMRGKLFPEGRNLDLLGREDFECAVMDLPKSDPSLPHYHKLATEVTYVLSGRLKMIIEGKSLELEKGDFMVLPPKVVSQNPENDPGTIVFVVKVPSVRDDKFYAERNRSKRE